MAAVAASTEAANDLTADGGGVGSSSNDLNSSLLLAEPPTLRRTLFTDEGSTSLSDTTAALANESTTMSISAEAAAVVEHQNRATNDKVSNGSSETVGASGTGASHIVNTGADDNRRRDTAVPLNETPNRSRAVSPRKSPFPDTSTAWRNNNDTYASPQHPTREPSPHAANQSRAISPRMSAALAVSNNDYVEGADGEPAVEGGDRQQHSPPASPVPVVDLAAVSNASRERTADADSATSPTETLPAAAVDIIVNKAAAATEVSRDGQELNEAVKDESTPQPPPPPPPVVLTRRPRGSSPKANTSTSDASNAHSTSNTRSAVSTTNGNATTTASTTASTSLSQARSALVAASDERAAAAAADSRPKRIGSPHRPAPSSLKPGSPRASSPKASFPAFSTPRASSPKANNSSSITSGFTGSGSPKASRHRSAAPSPVRSLASGGLAAAARAGIFPTGTAPHLNTGDSAGVGAAGAVPVSSQEERLESPRGQASKSWRSQSSRTDRQQADNAENNEDKEGENSAPRGGSPFLRLAAARRSRSLTQNNGNNASPLASSSPGPPSPRGPIAAAGLFGPHRGRSPTSSSVSSSTGSKGPNSPARSSSSSSKTPSPLSLSGGSAGGGVGFPRQPQSSRRQRHRSATTDTAPLHVAWATDQDPHLLAEWRVVLGCSSHEQQPKSLATLSNNGTGSSTTNVATSANTATVIRSEAANATDQKSTIATSTSTITSMADAIAIEAAELATALELSVNDHGLSVLKALQRTSPAATSTNSTFQNKSNSAGVALPGAVYEQLLSMYEDRATTRFLAKKKMRSRASSPLHTSSTQSTKPTAPAAVASSSSSSIPVVDLPVEVPSAAAAVDKSAITAAANASSNVLASQNEEANNDNNANGMWTETSVREAGRAYALKLALCFVKHGVYEVDRPKRPLPSTFSKRARRRPSPPPPPPKNLLPGDQKDVSESGSNATKEEPDTAINDSESHAEYNDISNDDSVGNVDIEESPDDCGQNDSNLDVDDSDDLATDFKDGAVTNNGITNKDANSDNRQVTVAEAHSTPLSPTGATFGAPFASLRPARPGSPRATGPPSRGGRGAGPGPVYFGGSGGRAGSRPPRVRSEAELQERALAKRQWQLEYGDSSTSPSSSDAAPVTNADAAGGATAHSSSRTSNHIENGNGKSAAVTALAAAVAEYFSSDPAMALGRSAAPVTVVGGVLRFKHASIRDFLVAKHLAEECAAAVHSGQQPVAEHGDAAQNKDPMSKNGAVKCSVTTTGAIGSTDVASSRAIIAGQAVEGAWGTVDLESLNMAGVRGFLMDFLISPYSFVHNPSNTNGSTSYVLSTKRSAPTSISGATGMKEARPSAVLTVTNASSLLQECLLDHLVVLAAAVAAISPALPSSLPKLHAGRTTSDSSSSGSNSRASHSSGNSTGNSSSIDNHSQGSISSGSDSSSSGNGNENISTRTNDHKSGSSDDSSDHAWMRCRRSLAAIALAPVSSGHLMRGDCLLHAATSESISQRSTRLLEVALSFVAMVVSAGMTHVRTLQAPQPSVGDSLETEFLSKMRSLNVSLDPRALLPSAARVPVIETFWTACHAAWQQEEQQRGQCNEASSTTGHATSKAFPLDCRRQDGTTPLDIALAHDHADAAALLRRCGAICSSKNSNIDIDPSANGSISGSSGIIATATSSSSSFDSNSSSNSVSLLEALEAKSFGGREWREPHSPTSPQKQQLKPPPPPARDPPLSGSDKPNDDDDDDDKNDDVDDNGGDEEADSSEHGQKDFEIVGGLLKGLDDELAGFLTSIDTEKQPVEETTPSVTADNSLSSSNDGAASGEMLASSAPDLDNAQKEKNNDGSSNSEEELAKQKINGSNDKNSGGIRRNSSDGITSNEFKLDAPLVSTPLKTPPHKGQAADSTDTPSRQSAAPSKGSSPPQQLSPGGQEADALAREMSDLLWSQAEADTQRAAAKAAEEHSRQTAVDSSPPATTAPAVTSNSVVEAVVAPIATSSSAAAIEGPTDEIAASVWAAERAGLEARVRALEKALQSALLASKNSSPSIATSDEATTNANAAAEAVKTAEEAKKDKEREEELAALTQRVEKAESDAALARADAAAARAAATQDADVAKRASDDVSTLQHKLAASDALLDAARAEAARLAEEAVAARQEASKNAEALAEALRQSKLETSSSHANKQPHDSVHGQQQDQQEKVSDSLGKVEATCIAAVASVPPSSEAATVDSRAKNAPSPSSATRTTLELASAAPAPPASAALPSSRVGGRSEANAKTLEILRASSRVNRVTSNSYSNTGSPSRSAVRRSSPSPRPSSSLSSSIDHRSNPDRHSPARGGAKPLTTSVFQESLRRFETASATRAPPAPTRSSTSGGSAGTSGSVSTSSTSSSPARSSSRSSSRSRFLPTAMAPPDTAPPTAVAGNNSSTTTTSATSAGSSYTTTTPVRTKSGMAPPPSPPPEAVRSGRSLAAPPPPAAPPTTDEKFSNDARSRTGGRGGSSSSSDVEHRRRSSNSPRRRTPTPDSAWIGRGARGVTDPGEGGAEASAEGSAGAAAAVVAASTSPRGAGRATLVGVGGSGPVLLRSASSASAAAAAATAGGSTGGAPPQSPRSSSSGAVARAAARLQRAAEQPASLSSPPPQALSSTPLEVPKPPPRRSGANGSTTGSPNGNTTAANSDDSEFLRANDSAHSTSTSRMSSHGSGSQEVNKDEFPASRATKQTAPSLTDFVAALPAERVRTPTRQQSYNGRSPGH